MWKRQNLSRSPPFTYCLFQLLFNCLFYILKTKYVEIFNSCVTVQDVFSLTKQKKESVRLQDVFCKFFNKKIMYFVNLVDVNSFAKKCYGHKKINYLVTGLKIIEKQKASGIMEKLEWARGGPNGLQFCQFFRPHEHILCDLKILSSIYFLFSVSINLCSFFF